MWAASPATKGNPRALRGRCPDVLRVLRLSQHPRLPSRRRCMPLADVGGDCDRDDNCKTGNCSCSRTSAACPSASRAAPPIAQLPDLGTGRLQRDCGSTRSARKPLLGRRPTGQFTCLPKCAGSTNTSCPARARSRSRRSCSVIVTAARSSPSVSSARPVTPTAAVPGRRDVRRTTACDATGAGWCAGACAPKAFSQRRLREAPWFAAAARAGPESATTAETCVCPRGELGELRRHLVCDPFVGAEGRLRQGVRPQASETQRALQRGCPLPLGHCLFHIWPARRRRERSGVRATSDCQNGTCLKRRLPRQRRPGDPCMTNLGLRRRSLCDTGRPSASARTRAEPHARWRAPLRARQLVGRTRLQSRSGERPARLATREASASAGRARGRQSTGGPRPGYGRDAHRAAAASPSPRRTLR